MKPAVHFLLMSCILWCAAWVSCLPFKMRHPISQLLKTLVMSAFKAFLFGNCPQLKRATSSFSGQLCFIKKWTSLPLFENSKSSYRLLAFKSRTNSSCDCISLRFTSSHMQTSTEFLIKNLHLVVFSKRHASGNLCPRISIYKPLFLLLCYTEC